MSPRPRWRQAARWNDEAGNVAVLVAILLLVFVGVAAVAVDLGAGWAFKRALVADLDAAALAGAQHLAASENCSETTEDEAEVVARQFYAINDAARDTEPDVDADCAELTVNVEARREVVRIFSSEPLIAGGYSTARGVPPGAALPLTICSSALPPAWLDDDASPAALSEPHTLTFDLDDDPCPGSDGFDGAWSWFGDDSAAGIADLLLDFPTDASIKLDPDGECRVQDEPPATTQGRCVGISGPGTDEPAGGPLLELLQDHVCADETGCPSWTILVHRDSHTLGGREFHPLGFLEVTVSDVVIPDPEPVPDPEDPEEPVDPEDPEDPVDPTDPEDPEDPEDPVDPTDPEDPEDPVDPTDPEDPEDPEDPVDPEPEPEPEPEPDLPTIALEFRGYRSAPGTVLRLGAGSYLCSVDGAPEDDEAARCAGGTP